MFGFGRKQLFFSFSKKLKKWRKIKETFVCISARNVFEKRLRQNIYYYEGVRLAAMFGLDGVSGRWLEFVAGDNWRWWLDFAGEIWLVVGWWFKTNERLRLDLFWSLWKKKLLKIIYILLDLVGYTGCFHVFSDDSVTLSIAPARISKPTDLH